MHLTAIPEFAEFVIDSVNVFRNSNGLAGGTHSRTRLVSGNPSDSRVFEATRSRKSTATFALSVYALPNSQV